MSDTSGGAVKADYSFGQIAIRENICTFEQVKECLDIQSKLRTLGIEPKKLGEILIEKGYLTPDQAVQVAKAQASSAAASAAGGSSKLTIPGYELIAKIGQGAMGTVYKAKQLSMDRVVAIKVLSSRYSKDRTFVERFLREARAVAKLNHENIISGYDVGEANGHHYFVMEFVDGAPVTNLMKQSGRLEEQRCLKIAVQVARALSHAHKHGFVHRDIKPENIMLTSAGGAKLCDLGLAKQTKGDGSDVTMDGTSVGTPNYISPEQARGEDKIDIRSDIYSLGASLYHMAVGGPPFSGANPMVVMTKHVTDFPEPPKKRCASLSDGFSALVMKMMQKRREDRPQDPEALIHDLERLLNGEPLHKPETKVPRAVTHHTHTARSHGSPSSTILPAAKSSSSGMIMAALLGAGAVIAAVVFFTQSGDPGPTIPAKIPETGTAKNPIVIPAADPEERARKDVARFQKLVDSQITDETKPDRFTEPYATINKMIEKAKQAQDFAGQKIWSDELTNYTAKVNTLISTRIWAPVKAKADVPFNDSNYTKALEELAKFEDVYKYFRNDDKVERTSAGKDHHEYLSRIAKRRDDDYLKSKMEADIAFKNPKQRDEAYKLLDAAADSASLEQREMIDRARLEYLQKDVAEVLQTGGADSTQKALARIAALRRDHSRNAQASAFLDRMAEKLRTDAKDASTAATSQAMTVYSGSFRPGFDEALRRRDLTVARKALFDIYFTSSPQLQTIFLPAPTDNTTLKAYLDPARAGAGDTHKVVSLAEEGIKFTALRSSQYEAARELYVDLRITALLEELLDQAAVGASIAGRDAGKFKTGYSSALSAASSVEAAPRKAGEGPGLVVLVGSAKSVIPLAPAGKLSLPEDDIVALAKRAPGAASDPRFALKSFYLYVFADRAREAKDALDRITSVELKIGTERYTDRFKGMTSAREEDEAKKAFNDAWELYYKKKDTAGGSKKFKEVLDRYSGTEYLKTKVPPNNRTRIDILQDMFGGVEGKPKGMRPSMRELFAGAEIRDLGRGRYEVTYSGFKDDKDLAHFVPEGLQMARNPAGLGLQGNGLLFWNVPLKGNASIEVSFRSMGDGGLGLALHADSSRAGYLAVADLGIPNAASIDAIFKMPIGEGAQALAAIIAQGGTGIQLQKNVPSTASLAIDGAKLRFTVGRGELLGENSQFTQGKAGIGLLNNGAIVDRIKITGEIDSTWLDGELRRIESK